MDQVGDFNCNILWTRQITSKDIFDNLHDFQMVNHFPNSVLLADKKDLYICYKEMQGRFGESEFDYHPGCYTFPEEYEEFVNKLETWKAEGNPKANKKWIFKPANTMCGDGIFIFDAYDYQTSLMNTWKTYQDYAMDLELDHELDHEETKASPEYKIQNNIVDSAVISEYLDKPLLFKGFKFDLRIYVVITSFYPLKIYVYREGLVRLATTKYTGFNSAGYDKTSHLTNTSINKLNKVKTALKQYDVDISQYVMSLSAFFTQLKKEGVDIDLMWDQIYDIFIKTILSIEKHVSGYTKDHFQKRSKCFEIFGFDVLIDKDLKPWLLEVNLFPSFALPLKLDKIIKINLIHNLFNLVGIRDIKTATCDVSEQKNSHRHIDRKTGTFMNDEEHKS
jgi:tubulin polyglutamylase TTLL5